MAPCGRLMAQGSVFPARLRLIWGLGAVLLCNDDLHEPTLPKHLWTGMKRLGRQGQLAPPAAGPGPDTGSYSAFGGTS